MIPKPTAAIIWSKVIICVDKRNFLELHSRFYDDDGQLINTMNSYDIRLMHDRIIPTRFEMIPADKKGQKTEMIYKSVLYNSPIDEMVERMFEMGMLVAIGMKKGKLIMLLLYESVFTVLAGCFLGIIASIPLVFLLNRHPIKIGGETANAYERFGFEAIFPASTAVSIFVYQGVVELTIGLLLSLYPVYKVIRLDPVKAMKR